MHTQEENAVQANARLLIVSHHSRPPLWTLLAAILLLATSIQAATFTWKGVGGSWSDGTKWVGEVAPPSDGSADIYIITTNTHSCTIDSGWAVYGAVNSVTFGNEGASICTFNKGAGVTGLKIGAGGVIQNSGTTQRPGGLWNLTASQVWSCPSNGYTTYYTSLVITSAPSVVITKTGSGGFAFNHGNDSATGFQGSFNLMEGGISMDNSNYRMLGSNPLTIGDDTTVSLSFSDWGEGTCPTPLVFTNKTQPFRLTASGDSNLSDNRNTVTMAGGWNGNLVGGTSSNNSGEAVGGGLRVALYHSFDRRYPLVLTGSGTLSSDGSAANGLVGVLVFSGPLILSNSAALGPNNRTSVGLGAWNSTTIGTLSSLLSAGFDVSAPLRLFACRAVSNSRWVGAVGEAGILSTNSGLVTFSGNIYMESTNTYTRLPSLRLRAPAGSTARFSGNIQDVSAASATNYCPVVIHGGTKEYAAGTVEFTGTNTYQGTTAIRSGTLVVTSSNALASGAVSVGDTVAPIAPARAMYVHTYGNPTNFGLFTVDGVALNEGDRVLYHTITDTKYNGIWTASAGPWNRVADLDSDAEHVPGLQVAISEGNTNSGKRLYLPPFFDGGANFSLGSSGVTFNEDALNPDVAFLLSGSFTATNAITVTANSSTGRSILGSTGTVTAGFSGPVTLNRSVFLTTSTGGSTIFSGNISGTGGVTAANGGLLKLTGNKTYTGATVITNGSFQASSTLASTSVTFGADTTFVVDLTSTNTYDHLTLTNGSVALNNAQLTVNMVGGYAPVWPAQFPIVTVSSPATVSGTFACGGMVSSVGGGSTFTVTYTGTSVVLAPAAAGSIIMIQ